jgi:hypothetical protein
MTTTTHQHPHHYPLNTVETKAVRAEIRALKSALNARQKTTAREVKKRRDFIRKTEKEIARFLIDSEAFTRATTDRLAILAGRLDS